MKSPDDAQPSGDRTIGRLLIAALERTGGDVHLVSHLRTWSGTADPERLDGLRAEAERQARRLIEDYTSGNSTWVPDIWFTYHSYYKAPDLLGPKVAAALGIPYVITEASYSARRGKGDWADWLSAARDGMVAADAIFSFTARDRAGLREICLPERLHDLAPFLDLDAFGDDVLRPATKPGAPASAVHLMTVAMMRPGAKLASYQLLGDALTILRHRNWHLDIIGDGNARSAVEAAFAELPAEKIRWHGRLDAPAVRQILTEGDIFVWPGIDEAFGMAYLEAQAVGLPVVALRTAGVPEVVRDGETGCLAASATPEALAGSIEALMNDPNLRRRLSAGARSSVEARHSLTAASAHLGRVLRQLIVAP
jgi:glycosyltransferase involved in cell wall biosynthesis